jgi:hypothetical protein
MSENSMSTPSGQDVEGAASTVRDLPAETAGGHVDPATTQQPPGAVADAGQAAADAGFTTDAPTRQDGDPSRASSEYQSSLAQHQVRGPRPLEDMHRSDTSLGDRSTQAEASRQALGVEPEQQSDGEIEDMSTGETTRDQV